MKLAIDIKKFHAWDAKLISFWNTFKILFVF